MISIVARLWFISGEIISPKRSQWTMQDWQRWQADNHGLQVETFACDDGLSSCLIVRADPNLSINQRGERLRQQLQLRHINLPEYGSDEQILVMLHGKNSRKEQLLYSAIRYVALGYVVVLPDLPAHGDSQRAKLNFALDNPDNLNNSPSSQSLQPQVLHPQSGFAYRILQETRKQLNKPNMPASLWAMSLGSVYANQSVAQYPNAFQSLVIISGMDRFDNVMLDQVAKYPRIIQQTLLAIINQFAKLRIQHSFSEVTPALWINNPQVTLPVLVVHGDKDSLINIKHGKALFDSYASQDNQFIRVQGGGHNDLMVTPAPTYADIGEFLLTHRARQNKTHQNSQVNKYR